MHTIKTTTFKTAKNTKKTITFPILFINTIAKMFRMEKFAIRVWYRIKKHTMDCVLIQCQNV